jgi:hypothetical protein
MTDPPDPFETDLRRFTPRAPSPALEARLAATLDPAPLTRADRFLLATLATAAAAACLAITLVALDLPNTFAPAPVSPSSPVVDRNNIPRAFAGLNDSFDLR